MKFYTTKIDEAFFDKYIKEETSNFHFEHGMVCYVIEVIVPAVGEGELWLCSFYPVILCKRTDSFRTELSKDEFLKLIPDLHMKDVCDYIEMLTPSKYYV